MKSIFLSILLFSCIHEPLNAQDKQHLNLEKRAEELRQAMINPAESLLESLVWDELSYGHSSGVIDDKKAFIEKLVSGKSDFVSINLENQSISVKGKTAIIRHKLKAITNDSGKAGEVNLFVMLVWVKKGGKWKLFARQAVRAV